MTLYLKDRFESADFSRWTDTRLTTGETASVEPLTPHHGKFHAKFYDDGSAAASYAECYLTFASLLPQVATRAYFMFLTAFPASNEWYEIMHHHSDTFGQKVAMVMIWNDGGTLKWRLQYWSGLSWTYQTVTLPSFVLNRWYEIQLDTIVSGTVGEHQLEINKVLAINLTGLDNDRRGDIEHVSLGASYSTGAIEHTVNVDCAKIADYHIGPELPPIKKISYGPNLHSRVISRPDLNLR